MLAFPRLGLTYNDMFCISNMKMSPEFKIEYVELVEELGLGGQCTCFGSMLQVPCSASQVRSSTARPSPSRWPCSLTS